MDKGHWEGESPDPEKYFGFVYLIECLSTGKKYIGKKQYWAARSGVKGCKSKVTDRCSEKWKEACWRESDWRTYTGSSKSLNEYISERGKEDFKFQILSQQTSKGALHYAEIEEQVFRDVLRARQQDGSYEYFNGHIAAIKFRPPNQHSEETSIVRRLKIETRY